MIWLVMIFVSIICSFLQLAVAPFACLGQAKLPLLLAVIIYYALNYDTGTASIAALFCGLLNDVMSFIPEGQTSMMYLVMVLVISRFRKVVHGDDILVSAVFGGVSGIVSVFIGYHLLKRDGLIDVSAGFLWLKAFGAMLLGAVSVPIVSGIIHRVDSMVGNIEIREVIEDVID